MSIARSSFVVIPAILAVFLSLSVVAPANPTSAGNNYEWTSIHGGIQNQRYAPLDQINAKTIDKLGAVWISEPFADGATSRMTPVMNNGVMFFGAGPRIYAIDARTGKTLWIHETAQRKPVLAGSLPGVDQMAIEQAAGASITRAFGLGIGGGMIFAGMMNGEVIALDEKSGDLIWKRDISKAPLAVARGIVCTPIYVNGTIFFGYGHEFNQGHAIALDAKTGNVKWDTATVPEPGHPGHETWPANNDIYKQGDADPWGSAAVDPALDLVYMVTANPGPPGGGALRPGNNLYSDSVVAFDMKDGGIRWHHQLIHHDVWEADLSVPPVLFDHEINGRQVKGIAVIRGDGNVFEFDRETGEPLLPIEERIVPQNPELHTAATQPFPIGAQTILPSCESWRNKIPSGFQLGCMFDPPMANKKNMLAPFASVRVAPMAYDPRTGYLIAQGSNSLMWVYPADDPYVWTTNIAGYRIPGFPAITATVAAVDTRTGRVVWRKELPAYDGMGYRGNGGSLTTAGGLVFHQGGDGTLQAYDIRTGRTLWRFQTDYAVGDAPPISYELNGKQYVAFISGTKVWGFALGGKLPQSAPVAPQPQEKFAGAVVDTSEIETLSLEQAFGHGKRYRLNEYAPNPYRARVVTGTQVKFINNGYENHTIEAVDGSWKTATLAPAEVGTIVFDRPGSYAYRMKEHPWVYGEVIVVAVASVTSTAELARGEQVTAGRAAYQAQCAACHGTSLEGHDPAPSLTGSGLAQRWSGQDTQAFYERIRSTMPLTSPGSLSDDTYTAIVAFIRANNGDAKTHLDTKTMKGLPVVASFK
jgi:glucose dehydrogenase/plastocyanin/cytochrome c5